jgi:hypothetical protein
MDFRRFEFGVHRCRHLDDITVTPQLMHKRP